MYQIPINTNGIFELTDEDFFHLSSQNKSVKFERNEKGEILVIAPSSAITSSKNSKLNFQLSNWNNKNNEGIVFDSSGGFTLPDNSILSPDYSWILNEKWNSLTDEEKDRFPRICPDFVIELMSKSDYIGQTKAKMLKWIENGCRLAWLIDPYSKTTFIYRANHSNEEKSFSQILTGEDVLVDFTINLSEIFN